MLEPLKHSDLEKKDDATLAQEAAAQLARVPALQLAAELLAELRGRTLGWWTPDGLRTRYSATERMRWLRERADVRQQITTSLTGLVPKAARKKDPDFQASLLDAAVDDGDVPTKAFEDAFDLRDLVVYGPVADYWKQFRARMPWAQDVPAHQEIVAFLLRGLLVDKGPLGLSRRPILTPWDVRTAISSRVWHTRIPVDVRAAIDDARFERERKSPRDPFHAKDDLAIALPEVLAQNIPLKEFARVLDAAERAMGFDVASTEVGAGAPTRPPAESGSDAGPATVSPGSVTGAPGSSPPTVLNGTNGERTSTAPGERASTAPSGERASMAPSGERASMAPGERPSHVPGAPPPLPRVGGPHRPPPPRAHMGSASYGGGGGAAIAPHLGTEVSPTPPPAAVANGRPEDSEVLFEVELASSDDVVAALDRIEDRPTKA